MKHPVRAMCVVALSMLLCCCEIQRSSQSSPEPADSAGIAVWSIGPETVSLGLLLEKVGEVSLPDSGWVVEPDGVAVDVEAERIYLLDELGPRVLTFTVQGDFLGEIGNPGEGPGEFEMPVAIDVDAVGTVRIIDASRSLILSWDRDGHFIGQERLPAPYWGPGFVTTGEAHFYVRGDQDGATGSVREVLVRASGDALSELMTLVQPWVPIETPCGVMPVPKAPAPSIIWGGAGRIVATTEWPDYAIQVFEGDRLTAILRRGLQPYRVTESEAEEWVSQGPLRFLTEACGMTSAAVLAAAGIVELASPIDRTTVDPLDRIWAGVIRARDGQRQIDLLDLERGYLGSFSGSPFPVAFISASQFLALADHDWGSGVEIWRIHDG